MGLTVFKNHEKHSRREFEHVCGLKIAQRGQDIRGPDQEGAYDTHSLSVELIEE